MIIELINNQLAYIQPKYQLSTRKKQKIKFICIFRWLWWKISIENDSPKFEETELERASEEELKDD